MPALAPPPRLSEIAQPALLLDFDGTLVDLAATPDAITVPEYLGPALQSKAAALDGRLALVSGRFVGDLRSHLPDSRLVMCGSHGAEIESPEGSSVATRETPRVPDAVMESARAFVAGAGGVLLEEKALGLGLHYRDRPELADDVRRFARQLAADHDLHLREAKMLFELATTTANKGDGVRAIMAQPPFEGSVPVFVGDDQTDEDGFAAVDELGGFGILVGELRETKARYRLLDVAAVHDWLELE